MSTALRRPGTVGAVAPSSASLAEVLAAVVPSNSARSVVELGPGTGAVSDAIERRLPADARHVAVELDEDLAGHLRATRPRMEVLTGDAAQLTDLLAEADLKEADAVVSGLPWTLFADEQQRQIISQVATTLADGGAFTTFGYLHARPMGSARRFRHLLRETFDEVIVSSVVWRNVPPAWVYICRRPH